MGKTRRRTIGEEGRHLAISDEENDYYMRSSIDSGRYGGASKSSRDVSYGSSEAMLLESPTIRKQRKISTYLYRIPNRTMRWMCLALMATILLFMFNLTRMGMNSAKALESMSMSVAPPPAPWESFPFLKRYFGGLRTLTPRSQNIKEYPTDNITLIEKKKEIRAVPESQAYDAFAEYKISHTDAVECYLDSADKIKVPRLHNYKGIPKGMPEPVYGSSSVMGLSEEYCFDRYGRLGPYGFGYSSSRGGIGAGIEGEREGSDEVWASQSAVDYSTINWHEAQSRCLEKNKHRFAAQPPTRPMPYREMRVRRAAANSSSSGLTTSSDKPDDKMPTQDRVGVALREKKPAAAIPSAKTGASTDKTSTNEASSDHPSQGKTERTAFIIRTWSDYEYKPEVILYLRALISELALTSSGEYTVHFLIHVKNDNEPIWADPDTYDRILRESLPAEFRGMGTLWTEREMNLIYGGLQDTFYRDIHVHAVYRSAHFPLQYFAQKHPEYDYFWNWEMDTRYTGHWLTLFEKAKQFAKDQPRKGLWERNERFYVPEVHGTWEDFKQMVRVQSEMPVEPSKSKWANLGPGGFEHKAPEVERPIWGPKPPAEGFTPFHTDPKPPTTYEKDKYVWGVGEEADLITFNPMFDPTNTDWNLKDDVTSYDTSNGFPPRKTSVVAASRISRRLITTMHNETTFYGHTMFTEMFPPTMALHHGLKAVYAPNPTYIDRAWPVQYLAKVLNAGINGAVGGARTTVFGDAMQHNLRGVTWHYNDGFAPNLWRRWLGYRVDNDGGEEQEVNGEGRMCLPPILLHPIKDVDMPVEEPGGEEQS